MSLFGELCQDAQRYNESVFTRSWEPILALRHPGFRMITSWRIARLLRQRGVPIVPQIIRQSLISRFACDLSLSAMLGPGLRVPHPVGIVIGEAAQISSGTTIMQHVTLGGNSGTNFKARTMPSIGPNSFLGPGAILLGPIELARDSFVKAHATVVWRPEAFTTHVPGGDLS